MKKSFGSMIYTILVVVGISLVIGAAYAWNRSITFMKDGLRTTATVREMISYRDSDGDMMYKPVFEYSTLDNRKHEYVHTVGSRPASWKVGETTGLIYDQNDPSKVKITTYFGLFGWCIVLLSIAAPLIIIGAGYFLTAKYR